ncbi:MAG: hypothetical protein ACXU7D_03780 [Burkholderiaceae bacterium]
MSNTYPSDTDSLRAEIAVVAARMIAEDGLDYSTAKRKAAKQLLGDTRMQGSILPDNAQVEEEVRQYNALFFGEMQPARLLYLRQLALQLMEQLQPFSPYLTGAVLNGTAGQHSDIHLQLFADSPKDVEIFLLNKEINFDVTETDHFKKHKDPVETISFMWQKEGVHLAIYQQDDFRGALKKGRDGQSDRASINVVRNLIVEST